jgi:hypothetical protein
MEVRPLPFLGETMNTKSVPQNQSQELLKQVTARIEELARLTDAARISDAMLRYLDTMAKFHQYSLHNIFLILMACPDATVVAGFQAWRKLNRYVRKGERGIPILAPILVPKRNEEKGPEEKQPKYFLRGFKIVYVFSQEQTEGEPLPEAPDWKSPERNAELHGRLIAFAKAKDITVTEKPLHGETQGVSKGGSIEITPTAGTSTLIHEIAHELMHRNPDAPAERGLRELEAEAVAYVVARQFGLESDGSPNYIALHGATGDTILAHLERIRKTVKEITQSIEGRSEMHISNSRGI